MYQVHRNTSVTGKLYILVLPVLDEQRKDKKNFRRQAAIAVAGQF